MPGPSGKPLFHVAPNFGQVPSRTMLTSDGSYDGYFEDTDDVWQYLLRSPPVGRKEGSCVRGAVFSEQAQAATQLNVEYLDGLVLDADEFPDGRAYTFDEVVRRLFGHRFIIWTTYNSTPARPRYRIVLPMARSVPRRQFRALWEMVNNDLGNVIGHKQYNADRLGYLPRVNSETHRSYYQYAIHAGPLFDPYVRYGEIPETPDRVHIDNFSDDILLDRGDWVTDDDALAKARSYMRQAHMGIQPGARHHKLFEKACQLWWDFYLDERQVRSVLLEVNSRFSQPKQPAEVLREVEAGYAQTRGPFAKKQSISAGLRRSRPPPVTLTQLKEAAKKLKRKQHDLASALTCVADGKACVSAVADIVPVLRGLARLLGELYTDADARQLAGLLHDTQAPILSMYGSQLPSAEHLTQIVYSRQEENRSSGKHKKDVEDQALAAVISDATGGRRSTPYSLDEFSDYARLLNETHESLKRRLIVQFGPSFFFFCEGKYTPGVEHNREVAARKYLSLARPFGVEVHKPAGKEGTRPKTGDELLEDYGSIAHKAIYSFSAKQSRYDTAEQAFLFAQTPLRQMDPFRCSEIEDYLSGLVDSEDTLDWLAHLPNLDRPARLLYLWGPKDCGKSFLPKCMSRLWTTTGPSKGDALFGSFNEGIGRCPLVQMDETLPAELRGARGTELLRAEISETTRPMTQKFKKEAQMIGALRFVFSANDPGHIVTTATLTKDDADAIADRLLTVNLGIPQREYLSKLGYERVARWEIDDLFARHVLWLRENRSLSRMDRFGPVPRSDGANQITQNSLKFSGAASDVMEFMYKAVARNTPVQDAVQVGVGAAGYQLLACLDEMAEAWSFSDGQGSARIPPSKDLSKALSALSSRSVRAWSAAKGIDRLCHVIDLPLIHAWIALRDLDRVMFDRKLAERMQNAARYM